MKIKELLKNDWFRGFIGFIIWLILSLFIGSRPTLLILFTVVALLSIWILTGWKKEYDAQELRGDRFVSISNHSHSIAYKLDRYRLVFDKRMKKYLREIEMAGVILAIIGIVSSLVWGAIYGGWLCGIGIVLFLLVFLYKAFHWKEYERENKQYIVIILLTIIILFIQMLRAK